MCDPRKPINLNIALDITNCFNKSNSFTSINIYKGNLAQTASSISFIAHKFQNILYMLIKHNENSFFIFLGQGYFLSTHSNRVVHNSRIVMRYFRLLCFQSLHFKTLMTYLIITFWTALELNEYTRVTQKVVHSKRLRNIFLMG